MSVVKTEIGSLLTKPNKHFNLFQTVGIHNLQCPSNNCINT